MELKKFEFHHMSALVSNPKSVTNNSYSRTQFTDFDETCVQKKVTFQNLVGSFGQKNCFRGSSDQKNCRKSLFLSTFSTFKVYCWFVRLNFENKTSRQVVDRFTLNTFISLFGCQSQGCARNFNFKSGHYEKGSLTSIFYKQKF